MPIPSVVMPLGNIGTNLEPWTNQTPTRMKIARGSSLPQVTRLFTSFTGFTPVRFRVPRHTRMTRMMMVRYGSCRASGQTAARAVTKATDMADQAMIRMAQLMMPTSNPTKLPNASRA